MQSLTDEGQRLVAEIAARHAISPDAALHMVRAVVAGRGTQAQFNHQEVGGMGQWSHGGMTMVGDMFNTGLKARVDALCSDIAGILRNHAMFAAPVSSQSQSQSNGHASTQSQGSGSSLFIPSAPDWPAELGQPASVGSQNDLRYAYFPMKRRLAIDVAGRISVYDTGDHQITGFGQAQSGSQSITLTSQNGLVRVADLPLVTSPEPAADPVPRPVEPTPAAQIPPPVHPISPAPAPPEATAPPVSPPPLAPPEATAHPVSAPSAAPSDMSDDQIFSRIERLAGLHEKGILSDAEYETKKAELLARL
ncbi:MULTISPECIES: SHOCT domain-containing protein [unclassified Marinovum]